MTRNAIVDALGVLKAGRIVDLTHLVHPGIQRFGPFPAMRIETRYTVAESGFHVEEVTFCTLRTSTPTASRTVRAGTLTPSSTSSRSAASRRWATRRSTRTVRPTCGRGGARLREVRARVRSLSGRGHGEPRQAALDGRRELPGPPEVRQVPGLPGQRMGGRAKRGLSAIEAQSAARGSRGLRRARI